MASSTIFTRWLTCLSGLYFPVSASPASPTVSAAFFKCYLVHSLFSAPHPSLSQAKTILWLFPEDPLSYSDRGCCIVFLDWAPPGPGPAGPLTGHKLPQVTPEIDPGSHRWPWQGPSVLGEAQKTQDVFMNAPSLVTSFFLHCPPYFPRPHWDMSPDSYPNSCQPLS